MTLESSVSEIVERLVDWSRSPKYALERRIDILLTPFIQEFVGWKLGGEATLVAAEFPILSRLDPKRRQRLTREPSRLTVNVDYLLLLKRSGNYRWVFLELKTDPGSFDSAQLRLYRIAQQRGMKKLLRDLALVAKRSKSSHKYDYLLGKMDRAGHLEAPVQIAYLSPEPKGGFPTKGGSQDHPETAFWTFEEFRSMRPKTNVALWEALRPLLQR